MIIHIFYKNIFALKVHRYYNLLKHKALLKEYLIK